MFKLSTRKLQQFNASIYVCLPITWIRNNNLKKLSKVDVFINDKNELMILPTEQNDKTQ